MAASNNPRIQQLMDEAHALDEQDAGLEEKLQKIAEAVAAEQQKIRSGISGLGRAGSQEVPTDPSDAFACEGCQ